MVKTGKRIIRRISHILEIKYDNIEIQGFDENRKSVQIKKGKYNAAEIPNPCNFADKVYYLPDLKVYIRLVNLDEIDFRCWKAIPLKRKRKK